MSDYLHEHLARKMLEDYGNYESPIERVWRETMADRVEQEENALVYRVSVEVGYNINKEELIKALQYDRNQYQKGFEDCARSIRLEQTEWIPVTERLPEDDEYVLVDKGARLPFEVMKFDLMRMAFYNSKGIDFLPCEVRAWMPLPKPYKAGEDE